VTGATAVGGSCSATGALSGVGRGGSKPVGASGSSTGAVETVGGAGGAAVGAAPAAGSSEARCSLTGAGAGADGDGAGSGIPEPPAASGVVYGPFAKGGTQS